MDVIAGNTRIWMFFKTIRHPSAHVVGNNRLAINRECLFPFAVGAQVVCASNMVVMVVGYEEGIKVAMTVETQHLLPEIRAAVDEQVLAF